MNTLSEFTPVGGLRRVNLAEEKKFDKLLNVVSFSSMAVGAIITGGILVAEVHNVGKYHFQNYVQRELRDNPQPMVKKLTQEQLENLRDLSVAELARRIVAPASHRAQRSILLETDELNRLPTTGK